MVTITVDQRSDQQYLTDLFECWQAHLRSFLAGLCQHELDLQLIDDLHGQLWLRVAEALPAARANGLGAPQAVKTWLFKIARNLYFDYYDYKRRRRRVTFDAVGIDRVLRECAAERQETTDPALLLDHQEHLGALSVAVQQALATLHGRQREMLLAQVLGEQSLTELAAQWGITHSAAKSLVFRARETLRQDPALQALARESLQRHQASTPGTPALAVV